MEQEKTTKEEELLFSLAAELGLVVFSDKAQTTAKIKQKLVPTHSQKSRFDKPFSQLT